MVQVLQRTNKFKKFILDLGERKTLSIFFVLLLIAGFGVTYWELNHSQEIRQNAAGPVNFTVTIDASTVKQTISPNFFGINYVGFWDNIQGSTPSQQALAQTAIRTVRFPGGAPADWYDWKNPTCQGWSSTSPLDLWNYTKGLGTNAKVLFQTNFQGNSAGYNPA